MAGAQAINLDTRLLYAFYTNISDFISRSKIDVFAEIKTYFGDTHIAIIPVICLTISIYIEAWTLFGYRLIEVKSVLTSINV